MLSLCLFNLYAEYIMRNAGLHEAQAGIKIALWQKVKKNQRASWETCMQVRKQQLELDMEQHTGSKSGKEYIKAVCCHPDDLTYMQSTSWETLGWMNHKLKLRLLGEISITSDMQMTPPLWQKMKN